MMLAVKRVLRLVTSDELTPAEQVALLTDPRTRRYGYGDRFTRLELAHLEFMRWRWRRRTLKERLDDA